MTVLSNDREWTQKAIACLRAIPTNVEFQADWFRSIGLPEPHHPNAWGAVIHAAAKLGLIEQVGFARSKLPSARARIVGVWKRKGES